ncbi:MAG: efflux RND transporter periplasmic adaptor subunit [Rubrivivax sp.]|nr:efflux RND transporter periplasmic adaptor subunit [Rubrivivax sp.]
MPLRLKFRAAAALPAALSVLLVAGTLGLGAARGQTAPTLKLAPKPALTVTTTQAQRSEITAALSANGNVAAWQEAIVGAEGNGWRLAEVRVNVGDVVKRGQVLATFVADLAQAEAAQSRAAVAEAEATLAEAAANAQRARELQPSGALSAQQVNQLLTAERTAQARLDAVRAAARVQQLRLAQAQVLAPDSGVISARSATLGAVVPAGVELFRLVRQGRLEWRAEVAAAELALVRPGQTVRVTAPGGGVVAGKVRMVAPTVDAATRNGLVYVDLPTAAAAPGGTGTGLLKPGMFARGEVETGRASALTLPQSAVLLRDGFAYVFKLGADNKVAQAKVAVGRRSGERIEVTAGLDAGTRVVASGAGFLADGDTVRVVDEQTPKRPGSAP